jgi:hypothetical protein
VARARDAAVLGDVLPVEDADLLDATPVRVRLEVVWGEIGAATADILAVGHYQNVYPTQAEAALDKAMSGDAATVVAERLLHGATARGVLTGSLGEVTLFPWDRDGHRLVSAIVGLGRPGTFGLPQHEVLIRNLMWTAERVPGAQRVAMVLIGSGASNLSIAEATESLVRSLDAAVRARELTGAVTTVQIVEQELGRAIEIHRALTELLEARRARSANAPAVVELPELAIGVDGRVDDATVLQRLLRCAVDDRNRLGEVLTAADADEIARAVGERLRVFDPSTVDGYEVRGRAAAGSQDVPTRLSVLVRNGELWVSAISHAATVSERQLGLEVELFKDLARQASEDAGDDDERLGEHLLQLAVPHEFQPFIRQGKTVIIEVDPLTATVPWELLAADSGDQTGSGCLGLRAALARQLRTTNSPPPSVAGRWSLRRALVIGDPGVPGGGGELPGARAEAAEVATLLTNAGVIVDVFVGTDATKNRVVYQLMNHEYDVIHYAGHGTFSSDDPLRETGWMFSDGLLLGRHLTMARRMPALVLANACHSGRVSETTGLPGLADEFMGRGVRNLVGTARAVDDGSALAFSRSFYGEFLRATPGNPTESLGRAVLKSRRELDDDDHRDWHVYQLYGDPEFRFWQDQDQS